MANGIPCRGWCPAGRLAEDGPVDPKYPLVELPGAGYRQRTRQNVIDSDGTVVMSFGGPTGGSKLTADFCAKLDRPCLVIDADLATPGEAAVMIAVFVLRHRIHKLNVAGPRASGQPGIYDFVYEVIGQLVASKRRRPTPVDARRERAQKARAPVQPGGLTVTRCSG